MGDGKRLFDEIVAQAMSLPPGRREEYVAKVCGEDDAQCAAVLQRVLETEDLTRTQPNAGVDESAAGGSGSATTIARDRAAQRYADDFPGYDVIRRLSQGGQGIVFQAIQRSTKREVAIKVLREEQFASSAARRRFEREIQTVAQLRHPDVISIFHAGETPDGRPFYVMAFVRGLPLSEYVRSRAVALEDALDLFARICSAIDYAHQRGVLHRDLKPSNILVDADGNPSVLDFGLAKWLSGPGGPDITVTQAAIGTPRYMAPEQVVGRPDEVDLRTDVYGLGVILYELLTGRFPYRVDGAAAQVFSNIMHAPPIPPERNWSSESGARSRTGTATASARCPIGRELRTIVLTALSKEPQRRYQSASAFANDIRRYLAGDPVLARGDSFMYLVASRARAIARRHRLMARVVVAVVAAMIVGAVVPRAVRVWTPLHAHYESLVTNLLVPARVAAAPPNARLIGLTDETDVEGLAATVGVSGVGVRHNRSLRRLHGKLMERLAAARPRVVAWDIAFGGETEYDEDFVEGVRALRAEGIAVVVTAPGWYVDENGWPPISRTIGETVRWGAAPMGVRGENTWRLDMCVSSSGRDWRPSLVTATLAAASYPDARPRWTVYDDPAVLETRYWRVSPASPDAVQWLDTLERIQLTSIEHEIEDDPEFGIQAGDQVGVLAIPHRVAAAVERVVVDYRDAMLADVTRRRGLFGGRIVVIADLRSGIDRHAATGGVEIPGGYVHVAAIDILSRQKAIREPRNSTMAMLILASAALGVVAISLAGASPLRRALLLAGVTIASAAVCVGAYLAVSVLCNPAVPASAALLAGGLALLIPAESHTRT